jgi:hypothetical protein
LVVRGESKMKKILKIVGAIGGTIILGYVGFVLYVYLIVFENPFNNKEFNKVEWQKYHKDMNPDNPRGEMFESLTDDYLKQGMSKLEVIKLLGKPDFKEEENFLSYNLGMWSGFRMDYDSLDLKFSNNGNLVKYYRVQH